MSTKQTASKKHQKIDRIQARIAQLNEQLVQCNRDINDGVISKFEKQLPGALLEIDGSYFAKASINRINQINDNFIDIKSKWIYTGCKDIPYVAKHNPFGSCFDKSYLVECLNKGRIRVHKDPKKIRSVIYKSIASYEDMYDMIQMAIKGCQEWNRNQHGTTPDLNDVNEKNAYTLLLQMNGSVYFSTDQRHDCYLWYRVMDIGDGTVLVKHYWCNFRHDETSLSALPDFYECEKQTTCVRAYPFDKRIMTVLKDIKTILNNKYEEFKPIGWEELNERLENIKKAANDAIGYARNGLIDYILDTTPDPTVEE